MRLAEGIRGRVPHAVQLDWKPAHEKNEIGDGETEEVEVGGCVHGAVPCYYHASADVPENAGHEDDGVDDAERN